MASRPKTSQPPRQIHLLHGNDGFRLEQAAREWLESNCAAAAAAQSLSVIRGDVETVDQALDILKQVFGAVNSFSMFSPQNVTWLRGVNFFGGTLFKSEAVKAAVEKLRETLEAGLGAEQWLLVTVDGKLDARSRLLKAFQLAGEVRDISRSAKEWELRKEVIAEVREELKKMGIEAGADAVEALAGRVGADSRLLKLELEKLDLFLGERRRLQLLDVESMVASREEVQGYHLCDCIGHQDLGRAMGLLQQMETQKVPEVVVMSTLHNSLREMAYLGDCLRRGDARLQEQGYSGQLTFTDPEAEAGFQVVAGGKARSPYRLLQLGKQSRAFTVAQLDQMLRLSGEAYDRLFRSAIPQYELLRLLMISLCFVTAPNRSSA